MSPLASPIASPLASAAPAPRKIFFSYPRDEHVALVERIKADLEAWGHQVWYDREQIDSGEVWRQRITLGLSESEQIIAFLSRHSMRRESVCLNEIAIALDILGEEALCSVLIEQEAQVKPPLLATVVQWLSLEDYQEHAAEQGWYRKKFGELVDIIEQRRLDGRREALVTLRERLMPLSFYSQLWLLTREFVGRERLIERYQRWLDHERQSKVFRIEGGPGVGKSAIAALLARSAGCEVMALHLCLARESETRRAERVVRSLSYQMAARLPDYRERLLARPELRAAPEQRAMNGADLWRAFINEPLAGPHGTGLIDRVCMVIIIDGLDEATEAEGRNELLGCIEVLPLWAGVVLTGRPDPELSRRLARYQPLVIKTYDASNLDDIGRYIEKWLDQRATEHDPLPATEPNQLKAALITASGDNLLHLHLLRHDPGLDIGRLDQLPAGHDNYYRLSIERHIGSAETARWQQVKAMLGYLIVSPAALPLGLLRTLQGWALESAEAAQAERGIEEEGAGVRSLGSLVERDAGDERSLAICHTSLADWLARADEHHWRAPTQWARQQRLAQATWGRYLADEDDPYALAALPEQLPALPLAQRRGGLATGGNSSIRLHQLAEHHERGDRAQRVAAIRRVAIEHTQTLAERDPENSEFQRDLWVSYWKLAECTPATQWRQAWQRVVQQMEAMQMHGALSADDAPYPHRGAAAGGGVVAL